MTFSARRVSALQHAIALGIATSIAVGTAGACQAATRPPANASETGWRGELVNQPNCWSEGRYDSQFVCVATGRR